MLEVNVHSTETGKDAHIEVEVKDEAKVMEFLQGVNFVQQFVKWLEER